MELYLLKSTICLALLFTFYKIVLENSSIHRFKRFYLLGSIAAAFLIPLITFTTYVESSLIVPIYSAQSAQIMSSENEAIINYWPIVLWTIYGLGVLFFSVKFFRNIYSLIRKIRQNAKVKKSRFIHVLLYEAVIPHTFLSYIFLNKNQSETGKIPAEVMLHEEAHAGQRHSLDIILIELLKIIFWFNPLFYFLKSSIKLNHEFLADRAVLDKGFETTAYQKTLLAFSTPDSSSEAFTPKLAHSINYSSMKKRFSIMRTNTSRRAILFRSLLILPLLSFLIYGFSTTEVITKQDEKSIAFATDTIEDIKIEIDKNLQIKLIGVFVELSDLKAEINKLNPNLTTDQKQKYLSASIQIETEESITVAEEVREILQSCDVKNLTVIILKNERDAGLKHIPQNNPMTGKTVEEAEVLHQEHLKEVEKFEKARANVKNDENNPWSVQVREEVGDEPTGKIVQQKATKAEIREYNKLAKKYNAFDIEKRIILKKDMERLKVIYSKMNAEQKAKAEPFPKRIPPPPPNKTGFYFNKNINTNIPIPPTPSFYNNDKDVKSVGSTVFMYEDRVITTEKANELLFNNQNEIFTLISKENGQEVIRLSKSPMENGKRFVLSSPSPFPLNNTSSEPNKGIDGATYYYNDNVITPEKADELLKNNSKLRIYITKTDDGKGTITLSETPISSKNNTAAPTPPIPPKPNSSNKKD